jgi:hypothetical protein
MTTKTLTLTAAFLLLASTQLSAQEATTEKIHGPNFVDEDGDGYNDNAPDSDGDGIPNGMDKDFVKGDRAGKGFIDEDGDGINDLRKGRGEKMGQGNGQGKAKGKNKGKMNGSGNGKGQGKGQHRNQNQNQAPVNTTITN